LFGLFHLHSNNEGININVIYTEISIVIYILFRMLYVFLKVFDNSSNAYI